MPANTIVLGFISVCRWSSDAPDTDCIRSMSIAARLKQGFGGISKVQFHDIQNLGFAHLYFTVRRKDSLVLSNLQSIIPLNIAFLSFLLWVSPFYHVRLGVRSFYSLSYWCPRCQESSRSFFSDSFNMILSHVL